jgi:hypothetical protein
MGSKFAKFIGMAMVLFMFLMIGVYMVFLLDEGAREGFEIVVAGLLALGGVSWILFRGPVGKAIAAMLEGTAGGDPALAMRVDDLEDRLAEVSLETQRLMEIEDRLDFTERLLAQQTDPGRMHRREGGE